MDEVKMVNWWNALQHRQGRSQATMSRPVHRFRLGVEAVPGVDHQGNAPITETIRADHDIEHAIDQQFYAMLELAKQHNDPVRQSGTLALTNLFRELTAESSAPRGDW